MPTCTQDAQDYSTKAIDYSKKISYNNETLRARTNPLQLGGSFGFHFFINGGRTGYTRDGELLLPTAHAPSRTWYVLSSAIPFFILNSSTDAYRDEHYDRTILEEMGELGLLGATINGYGCAGISSVASGLITREVERIDSGYRSGMSVQSSLVMGGIDEFGTTEQKEKYIPALAKGNMIGCFGLTEPNHGSDPGSMESIAKPHPTKKGYFSLSGSKTWITNSSIAELMLVWVKQQDTGKIRGFLIEREKCPPGTLHTPPLKNKNGLRASVTGMIQMDEVPVPEENIFPEVEGLKGPFSCLNSARYGIAWGVMGALEDCIDRARRYALERRQFKNNPIAKYQLVQKKLSDAVTDAAYGTLAAIQVGRLKDQGSVAPEIISMIKRQNCDRALINARA